MTCCDLHGRNCEPPSELCCEGCTEAAHRMGDAARGVHMEDGSTCSNPNLSPNMVTCFSCGGSDPRCGAGHPEYGFTCILSPHDGPHYDTAGGHWDMSGQLFVGGPAMEIRAAQRLAWANKLVKGFNVTDVPLEFCLLGFSTGTRSRCTGKTSGGRDSSWSSLVGKPRTRSRRASRSSACWTIEPGNRRHASSPAN